MSVALVRTAGVLLMSGALAACDLFTSPTDHVETRVEVTPPVVHLGGSVNMLVMAENQGSEPIGLANGCAPGLVFRITLPNGQLVDPYAGLAFTCQGRDDAVLEPAETDSVRWSWRPPVAGTYLVIGGLAAGAELAARSGPAMFEAR